MRKHVYLTDDEVARLIRRSTKTLQRIVSGFVRGGSARKTYSAVNRDLSKAEPETTGGYRLWRVDKLAKLLEMTPEQILEAIEV